MKNRTTFQCDNTVCFHALKEKLQQLLWFLSYGHDEQEFNNVEAQEIKYTDWYWRKVSNIWWIRSRAHKKKSWRSSDIQELNTERARIIRGQNVWHLADRRTEVTQEKCTQAREISATQQRARRKRRAVRFVSTIGEIEFFQKQVHIHQLLPMEEICQLCQAFLWKTETGNSCCRGGKVVLAPLRDPSKEFNQVFKDTLF